MGYRSRDERRRYAREHYQSNKADYKRRSAKFNAVSRRKVREYISRHLSDHHCISCGESDPVVLEFDHRDPATKLFNIGNAVSDGYSVRSVAAEIAKCDVRCANCHRRKTKAEQPSGPSRRLVRDDYQLSLAI